MDVSFDKIFEKISSEAFLRGVEPFFFLFLNMFGGFGVSLKGFIGVLPVLPGCFSKSTLGKG